MSQQSWGEFEDRWHLLLEKGQDCENAGDIDGAIGCWETFIAEYQSRMPSITESSDPQVSAVANACYNVGNHYDTKGSMTEAIDYLEKALSYCPDDTDYLFNHGMFCGKTGDHPKAVQSFRTFLELRPTGSEADQIRIALKNSLDEMERSPQDPFGWQYNAIDGALSLSGDHLSGVEKWKTLLQKWDGRLKVKDQIACHYNILFCLLASSGGGEGKGVKEPLRSMNLEKRSRVEETCNAIRRLADQLTPGEGGQTMQEMISFAKTCLDFSISIGLMEWGKKAREQESKGCFIATAACDPSHHHMVIELQRFRDEFLLESAAGQRLVSCYCRISPPLAARIGKSKAARWIVRQMLINPMVVAIRKLRASGESARID